MLNGSRRSRDVASHAQKYFIKLYKANEELPAKVRITGEGYTLSGKPLDPNSAAARAYGIQGPDISRLYREGLPSSTPAEPIPVSRKCLDKLSEDHEQVVDNRLVNSISKKPQPLSDIKKREKEQKAIEQSQDDWEERQQNCQHLYGEDGRTEYSRKRVRRKASSRYEARHRDALEFVRVSPYVGAIASGGKSQPFHVQVHSTVYATVDLHAHSSMAEIIGLLGGRFDASKLTIFIEKAFPGKSLLDGETECEMDPVVEVSLRDEIRGHGLIVVGWYHSHPTFECVPSNCDISNQVNYQALFRNESLAMELFLGLIITPYDPRLPSERSQYDWFYVESSQTNKIPKHIETSTLCETRIQEDTVERMGRIVESVADDIAYGLSEHSVKFDVVWREKEDGEIVTFLVKLRRALESWLPPAVFRLGPLVLNGNDISSRRNEEKDAINAGHTTYVNEILDGLLLRLNI